jgi:hypothetical protein
MTDTSPDEDHETTSLKIAVQKIASLLKRLASVRIVQELTSPKRNCR